MARLVLVLDATEIQLLRLHYLVLKQILFAKSNSSNSYLLQGTGKSTCIRAIVRDQIPWEDSSMVIVTAVQNKAVDVLTRMFKPFVDNMPKSSDVKMIVLGSSENTSLGPDAQQFTLDHLLHQNPRYSKAEEAILLCKDKNLTKLRTHTHTYTHTCADAYAHTYTHAFCCSQTYIRTYIYTSICMHVCMYVCASVCMSVCMYICMHTYTYRSVHISIYACTHYV